MHNSRWVSWGAVLSEVGMLKWIREYLRDIVYYRSRWWAIWQANGQLSMSGCASHIWVEELLGRIKRVLGTKSALSVKRGCGLCVVFSRRYTWLVVLLCYIEKVKGLSAGIGHKPGRSYCAGYIMIGHMYHNSNIKNISSRCNFNLRFNICSLGG
jgi:hypothetical protein